MKKFFLIFAGTLCIMSNLIAKDYFKDVVAALNNKDMSAAETLLKKWEMIEPDNPDLCIGCFNYYFILASENPVPDSFVVMTKKDGQQEVVERKIPDPEIMGKAVLYMDRGIKNYPDRLDFYTTRHQALFLVRRFDEMLQSAENMLKHSIENGNQWYWSKGPYDDGKLGMFEELDKVYFAFSQFFNTQKENYNILLNLESELYPDEAISVEHRGGYYTYARNYKEAVKYFEKAYSLDNDSLGAVYALANIYEKELKDKKSAIKWNEILLQKGTPSLQRNARINLQRLKG